MRRIVTILAAAMLAAACTADSGPGEGEPAAEPCDPDLVAGLSGWAAAGFSGAVALAGPDGFGCRAAFGSADSENGTANSNETVFAIGSVSKAFTAAAIAELAADGVIGVQDRAGDLVPGLAGPAAEVTVEQLLLHTSGLNGSHGHDHEPLSREDAIAAIGELESAFAPGSDYLYSNAGYTLLALIVDEATGSYREFMAAEVLRGGGFWDGDPAAPGPRAIGYEGGVAASSTGDFAGPHWAMEGNGDLAMTTADLAAWTEALFAGEVVSPEAVELLRGLEFDHGDGAVELPGWVSLDAEAFGTPVVISAGGGGDTGQNAVVAWLPETGESIAVASNTDAVTAEELIQAVGPALASGDAIPMPEGHVEADPAELAAAEGTYELDSGGVFTVTAAEDRLLVAADGADAVEALFVPGAYTGDAVAEHESAVEALLAGETAAGREEVEAVESDIGAIEAVELAGTVVEESELRTYVRITAEDGEYLAWYALDAQGGVAGVWLGAEPPEFTLVSSGDGGFRPENLSGAGSGLRVVFDADGLTVEGPGGTARAWRTD
ncbi:serine hydrolase domain-containing protein [Glycomyces sp. NPDC046736]|uniref:serine hydrolase domain-containing protein n=1 Tax=Glycomyces sp. NPDC046736 TaxID=3155615 RepID=UPI0033FE7BFA